jgi:hypothetical protein
VNASAWNGTDALGGFKYVRIEPQFTGYDVWVQGERVTDSNRNDVLNDGGSVIFIPPVGDGPAGLILTDAVITGAAGHGVSRKAIWDRGRHEP